MIPGFRRAIFGRRGTATPSSPDSVQAEIDKVLAEAQRRAEDSDNRHKAAIRAHSGRVVPPITDDGRRAIERAQHAHIAIKHIFPPRLPQRSMSYFGGLPIVPEEFDWPTIHNRKGLLERLNFVAQVDVSDIPQGPARDLLPESGYLYFFAPLSDSFGPDAFHFVTRYVPGKATQKWEPLDMPFTSPIEPEDARLRAIFKTRTHFDRVEIAFGWIEETSDAEVEARISEGHAFEVAKTIRTEKLDAFFGPAVPRDDLLSADRAPTDALWIPYPGFPANCQTARILQRLVETHLRKQTEHVSTRLKEIGDTDEKAAEKQKLHELQNELRASGSKVFNMFFPSTNGAMKDYDAPPGEAKQQILSLLEEIRLNGLPSNDRDPNHRKLRRALNDWIAFAAIRGAEGGLADPKGAPLIPPEVVSSLAARHAVRKHQMLGAGEVVQVAADEMKSRYILLFQLAPDPAVNWSGGEMGPLQYWITPEDLAAKRFESTVLTIEAY